MPGRKSFLDRFRIGSGRALIGLPDGPLAFAKRKTETAGVKKTRRRSKPDDLERRLILADQIGQLPELLVGYLPRLSTHHSFTLAEANDLAMEQGVTVFRLLADGANIIGLSKDDLDEYVSAEFSSLKTEEVVSEQNTFRAPPRRAGPPKNFTAMCRAVTKPSNEAPSFVLARAA
ncbi:hypothetical protein [Bosea sp. 124]|uniref:hypothetical protein n=1 Tax=Bosea sp. 124 TaxID=2135642 RepID=UPI000D373D68|nr:hypothetical protein [Bosea sp. 124]PTM39528.1 hypothetical protein C8D03_1029 [Bosea sp. 124]